MGFFWFQAIEGWLSWLADGSSRSNLLFGIDRFRDWLEVFDILLASMRRFDGLFGEVNSEVVEGFNGLIPSVLALDTMEFMVLNKKYLSSILKGRHL